VLRIALIALKLQSQPYLKGIESCRFQFIKQSKKVVPVRGIYDGDGDGDVKRISEFSLADVG
jgi:hypothetical protein